MASSGQTARLSGTVETVDHEALVGSEIALQPAGEGGAVARELSMTPRELTSEEALDLSRVEALMAVLGDPHRDFASVHVAGTKGKGSTAAMIEAVMHASQADAPAVVL